jgi:hypothetical protein
MVNWSGYGRVNRPAVQMRLIEESTVDGTHMTVMWVAVVMQRNVLVLSEQAG